MKKYRLGLIALLIITLLSSGVCAETEGKSEWRYSITPYMWFSAIDGDLIVQGDRTPADISFSELWDSLDSSFTGRFEAWKAPWGYFLDISYTDLSDSTETPDLTIGVDVTMWIVEAGIGHRMKDFVTEKGLPGYLDLLGGLRYYQMDLGVYPSGDPGSSGGEDWIDVFLGPRLVYPLSDKWTFLFRGNIGAGGSDLAWDALVGFKYQKRENFSLSLVYRILDIDYETGSGSGRNGYDARMSGPALAMTWYW